jgi:predicted permease
MRDWEQYVRDHLSLSDLTREREARILRELAAQLEDFYREAIARGMTDADADAHARAQITDWTRLAGTLKGAQRPHVRSPLDRWSERLDDRARERRGRWLLFADYWQDIRYASRRLLAQPAFTAVAVLTLALGIGANTAIFSLIDALLLDSLPVERPRELVLLAPGGPRNGWASGDNTWSYQAYLGLRERQRVFSGLIAERTDAVTLTIDGVAQRAVASMVSGNYFDVLGVRRLKGRLLTEADDRVRSGHPVVVLSYGFWVDRLGMQPDIVGRDVRIRGYPFTVVGIAEKRFNGLEVGGAIDLFVPSMMLPEVVVYRQALDARTSYIFQIYGRLSPGVTRQQAEDQLQPLYLAELEQDVAVMGARRPSGDGWRQGRVRLEDGHRGTSALRRDLATPLKAVMVMTVVLLIIACANIAGLQFAQASARVKEIAVRLAIGGSRARLVRQLLTESLLIAGLGSLAALAVAFAAIHVLVGEMGEAASRIQLATTFLNGRVLAFTLSLAVATTVLVGLAPALLATRPAVWPALTSGITADGRSGLRLRRLLVTGQIALSLVLVTAAGLFGRTVYNLLNTDAGFRTERLVQFRLNPGTAGYDRQRTEITLRQVLESIQSLPGVDSATLAVQPALDNALIGFGGLDLEGYSSPDGRRARAGANAVAPGYFRMMGTPLVRGRDFSETDHAGARRVAIVSETFVQRYLPNVDPIGRTIGYDFGGPKRLYHEIVGIAKDARFNNLRDAPPPTFYLPYSQFDVLSSSYVIVRAAGDPGSLRRVIDDMVRKRHPDLPIIDYTTLDDQIALLLRPERLVASLSLAFALLATGLGALGLYGVMAFSVARRTREIGLRMALGADRASIFRIVLRGAAGMCAIGIALGTVLALALGRYVESQLYGIESSDFTTLGAAASVLMAVAFASGWLPASRASRVDPMRALRSE